MTVERFATDGNIVNFDFGTAGQYKLTITEDDDEGDAGQVLTSNGVGQRPSFQDAAAGSGGGGSVDAQRFNSSGTWTKPSGFSEDCPVLVRGWGGGGSGASSTSGGAGGGGGGGYNEIWLTLSDLGATETVTVGGGGASVGATNANGNPGANTTLGSLFTAYAGGAGRISTSGGGGGGGTISAAATLGPTPGGPLIISDTTLPSYLGSGGISAVGWDGWFHGGGGGGGGGTPFAGGNSVNGGAGGGGCSTTAASSGGTSIAGGNGGAGAVDGANGTPGVQPGGGGGAAEFTASAVSGAGADGALEVVVFPIAA